MVAVFEDDDVLEYFCRQVFGEKRDVGHGDQRVYLPM
jgi:hypothetical protein